MKDAKPTFGHFVLAQILSKYPGNCVLTTNFDSLIETALYQYTDKTPLVCGHESLSGYAKPSNIHPLIIKIHRDLLLNPKNDLDEINKIDHGWIEPLDKIFSTHIPIVIGYGGNDGSLMNYFEQMKNPSNFFWCGRKGSSVSDRVSKLIKNKEGYFVEINDFDELMNVLLLSFDNIQPNNKELKELLNNRINSIDNQKNELDIKIKNGEFDSLEQSQELSAYDYAKLAENEPDYEKRKLIYLKALQKYPKTAWLWNDFTYFMQFVKEDINNLDTYYQKALDSDPNQVDNLGNYAVFLQNIKKDYINAEKYFLKALDIDPNHVNNIGNYAIFLDDIKNDFVNAEKYYIKALDLAPDDANLYGNYAIFLYEIKKDHLNAEKYYIKALNIDPSNANINGNYANYLKSIKKDFVKAEKYYLKALNIDPNHGNNNENFAIYLNHIKKDLLNAEKYYLKALDISPNILNFNGNYAQFLLELKKYDDAKVFLNKAMLLNNDEKNDLLIELWFCRFAHYEEYYEEAENKIENLLAEGIRSPGWNFDKNIEVALANGHPKPEKLKAFAEKISEIPD